MHRTGFPSDNFVQMVAISALRCLAALVWEANHDAESEEAEHDEVRAGGEDFRAELEDFNRATETVPMRDDAPGPHAGKDEW